jgi:hypothetical protein
VAYLASALLFFLPNKWFLKGLFCRDAAVSHTRASQFDTNL